MTCNGPTRPRKTVAVTVIGLLTLLLGGTYAVTGGGLIFAGSAMANDPNGRGLLEVLGGMLAAVGGAFQLQGVPMLLGGFGVLLRRQWGRILTLIMAVLAILWGVASMAAYDKGVSYVVFGAAQILYSILAIVVLVKNGPEFSRRRV